MIIKKKEDASIISKINKYDTLKIDTFDNLITLSYLEKFNQFIKSYKKNQKSIYSNFCFLVASCNNSYATMRMIESLFLSLGEACNIIIIDNGITIPLHTVLKKYFTIIDNYKFKIFANKNDISKNHAIIMEYGIQKILQNKDILYTILCDNDILFKPDFKKLLDNIKIKKPIICGSVDKNCFIPMPRLEPTLLIFNNKEFIKNNLHFYDAERLKIPCPASKKNIIFENNIIEIEFTYIYDTGASLYEDILKYNINLMEIDINDYIIHFKGLSYNEDFSNYLKTKYNINKNQTNYNKFINNNKQLLAI